MLKKRIQQDCLFPLVSKFYKFTVETNLPLSYPIGDLSIHIILLFWKKVIWNTVFLIEINLPLLIQLNIVLRLFNLGFRLEYLTTGCSRTYDAPNGRILSPRWPNSMRYRSYSTIGNKENDQCILQGPCQLQLLNNYGPWEVYIPVLPCVLPEDLPELYLRVPGGQGWRLQRPGGSSAVR